MLVALGSIIVIVAVLGGFVLSHGKLLSLWQPYEVLIIGGAAFGAFLIANPPKVVVAVFKSIPQLFGGKRYSKQHYLELLSLLYSLFQLMRRSGMLAVEDHIESPRNSDIFNRHRKILSDGHATEFICDYLRLMILGDMTAYEIESLMDTELEGHHHESLAPSGALSKVADALPGFGIVAAVLGIVITMQSLGGDPSAVGAHVAAALVGTFLGILLAYGFVGPMSVTMEHQAHEEALFYQCIKASLLATLNGVPPQVAVEFGRKTLTQDVRPSFRELERKLKA